MKITINQESSKIFRVIIHDGNVLKTTDLFLADSMYKFTEIIEATRSHTTSVMLEHNASDLTFKTFKFSAVWQPCVPCTFNNGGFRVYDFDHPEFYIIITYRHTSGDWESNIFSEMDNRALDWQSSFTSTNIRSELTYTARSLLNFLNTFYSV